jgi:hypothetical protein
VVRKDVGVGVVLGFTVGVIGGLMDIILLILDIGNNALAVSGVHKLRAVIAQLANK